MLNDNLFLAVFFLVLLIAFWWSLFKKKRPEPTPFPASWRQILSEKVDFYAQLSEAEKSRFEADTLQFLDKTQITGIDTDVNDADKLLVAASAVIPLF